MNIYNRQIDRQTDRQTDRKTDRQTDRHREREGGNKNKMFFRKRFRHSFYQLHFICSKTLTKFAI